MNAFDGVKVFAATTVSQRRLIAEEATRWLAEMNQRPGFRLVDRVVRQSSDSAYHCLSMIFFFVLEPRTIPTTPKKGKLP